MSWTGCLAHVGQSKNTQRGGLGMYKVDVDKCSGCETCIDVCPTEAISMVEGHAFIDVDECIECGACEVECPEEAIFEMS
jgi:ferredoxin